MLASETRLAPLPAPSVAPLPPVGRRGVRFESPASTASQYLHTNNAWHGLR